MKYIGNLVDQKNNWCSFGKTYCFCNLHDKGRNSAAPWQKPLQNWQGQVALCVGTSLLRIQNELSFNLQVQSSGYFNLTSSPLVGVENKQQLLWKKKTPPEIYVENGEKNIALREVAFSPLKLTAILHLKMVGRLEDFHPFLWGKRCNLTGAPVLFVSEILYPVSLIFQFLAGHHIGGKKPATPGDSSRDLFGMVKWPFQGDKWPPTRGWKGHFEAPGGWMFSEKTFMALFLGPGKRKQQKHLSVIQFVTQKNPPENEVTKNLSTGHFFTIPF